MAEDLSTTINSLLQDRLSLAEKERQLISELNRVLPELGYQVIARKGRSASTGLKQLECAECGRRFGHPLHLGRHMSATHRVKKGKRAA